MRLPSLRVIDDVHPFDIRTKAGLAPGHAGHISLYGIE